MPKRDALETQCDVVGWPISRLHALKNGPKSWSLGDLAGLRPEDLVAHHIEKSGSLTCWCEGGSINLLIKAAALDVLTERNEFKDRADAVERFLEAQLSNLRNHGGEILAHISTISDHALARNIDELLTNEFVQKQYPRVNPKFIKLLATYVPKTYIAQIAHIFMKKPYDFRSGWPDLTVIDDGLRFVEVKTTDLLHDSQIKFGQVIAAPLGLKCEVVRVCCVE
jgi:hypothetical protein